MTDGLIPAIIGFRAKPGKADIEMIGRYKGQIKYTYTLINAIAVRIPQAAIDAIMRNPNVEYVDIDELTFVLDPIDSVQALQYEINTPQYQIGALQQAVPWGIDRVGAMQVHPYTKGTGIKVAVIDTGIDSNHPDLSANYKGGYNFVSDNNYPIDDNGHGTHVAGIIAASDNDIGVIGVAPEAELYAVKMLDSTGSGYTSDTIAAIQWSVNNGMHVANMSFGSKMSTRSLKSACDAAYNKGLLLIAAAGNSGNVYGTGNNVGYPAKYDSVIAVAAIDINNNRAWWSSTGSAVELSAPGVNIYSTIPGDRYYSMSGTSMACPHVTGVVALVKAYNPSFTNVQVRIRMQITATNLGAAGRDNLYGYGLVNAAKAVLSL